ncbi:hypothetical protein [Desertivirga xinjiangensis]|nr:hypothetical protein [Pedobacter xinjiangensis]
MKSRLLHTQHASVSICWPAEGSCLRAACADLLIFYNPVMLL